ncbi:MAG: TetR/AcrR family transcriptional regulator [Candidatus Kapabacteria bacterium]|nr:TetR/AcrR family transcriptional regulator [Candidatus Kapabacteria bacterium]
MTQNLDLTLREKKAANVKLGLLMAASKRMLEKSLDEISVKELCDDVMISEGTFFNYFPKKTDLLIYYVQLWSVEVSWKVTHEYNFPTQFEYIREIFRLTAEKFQQGLKIMKEIIALFAVAEPNYETIKLSKAELVQAFPNFKGIDEIEPLPFYQTFDPFLKEAIQKGELPSNTDYHLVALGLWSIFFGVPLLMPIEKVEMVSYLYTIQLEIFWNGLKIENK